MYTCIGKRKVQGQITQCSNISETPSNPERPDWGFLCTECSGARYGRPTLNLDIPDIDKPNDQEFEPYELHSRGSRMSDDYQQSEQEELDQLQELEVL